MYENLENSPVGILVRDINGRRETFWFGNYGAAYAFVSEMENAPNSDEYEIQAVVNGTSTLYSALMGNEITWEDLSGFFA